MSTQPTPSKKPTPQPAPGWIDLRKFHFPLQAKLSITHRITGIISLLFLLSGLGILNLWILTPNNFDALLYFWQSFLGKLWLWIGLSALLFHWLAGIRHLCLEHKLGTHFFSPQSLIKLYGLFWLLLSWEIWT